MPKHIYVSRTGRNSNPGTQSRPYKTLNKAFSVAKQEDTLHIAAGTYTESVTMAQSFVLFLPKSIVPSGTNIYVSTTGNDTTGTGAPGAPYRTIQKASDVSQAGYIINVAPGTYSETLVHTVSGTQYNKIRFVSTTKWGAKITPVGTGNNVMWEVSGGYVDIDGFEIDGTGGTTTRNGIYLNGGNSSIKNCWVHHVAENSGCDSNGGAGIVCDQYRGAAFNNYDFIGNLVHDIGGSCSFIQGIYHSSSGTIKNNIVYATNYGIHLYHDDHNIDVVNNTVFGNRVFGIVYGGCTEAYNNGCPTSGINIYNNIIYDNEGGIAGPNTSEDTGSNSIKNNLVYGNLTDFDMGPNALSQMSGTIVADPQFVNYIRAGGGNYQLQSTSPAVDAGVSTYAPATDINGTPRPLGSGIDVGAYENF